MSKLYVTYESEQNNAEFINRYTKLSPEVQKLVLKKDETYSIEPFISLGSYKNVRSLQDLNESLKENEKLVIELKEEDIDLVNNEHIFSYKPVTKKTMKTTFNIGEKTYLVDYDFELAGLSRKVQQSFRPSVLLKRPNEDMYMLKEIYTITDSIAERRDDLRRGYGEYSNLYLEITDPAVALEFESDTFELTKIGPNKWTITKLPEYVKGSAKK